MKNLALLLLLVTSTVVAQKKEKVDRNKLYNYSESLEFNITKISKSRTTSRGNVTYVAKKGKRYISIMFKFINKSSKTQVIDFEKISLLDKNDKLNKIDVVVKALKLTGRLNRYQQKLKPKKKGTYFVEFEVPIPKKQSIKRLLINGEAIDIVFK